MADGVQGNRKRVAIAALAASVALLAGCGGDQGPLNDAAPQKAAPATPARIAAYDWGDPGHEYSGDPQYASSQALCRGVRGREPPAADRPDAATAAALRGCDAEALYYGIGVRRDPERARLCAFTQAPSEPSLEPFAGRAMLMTIYANGVGARRDLDIAMHLACGIRGAAANEFDARISHLARLRAGRRAGRGFHYCDDITSGLAGGLCAGHRSAIARPQREGRLRALLAGWTAEERRAFEPLRRAHEAFVQASASGDLERSGTAAVALEVQLSEGLRDEFVDMLQRLSTGREPHFTAAQLRTEDLQLNQAYRARLSDERQYDGVGISPQSIQEAQRAWLRYRDSFLAFAAVKFPHVPRDSLAAWITRNRSSIIPGF